MSSSCLEVYTVKDGIIGPATDLIILRLIVREKTGKKHRRE